MTRRDVVWRGLGLGLILAAVTIRITDRAATHAALILLAFVLTLAGLVLIVQGKRVPAALRVERGRHRMLAQAIHERRRRPGGESDT